MMHRVMGSAILSYTIDTYNVDNFPLKPVGSPAEPPVADFMYTLTFDNEYMDVAFFDDSTGELRIPGNGISMKMA